MESPREGSALVVTRADGSGALLAIRQVEGLGWHAYVETPVAVVLERLSDIRGQMSKVAVWVLAITFLLAMGVSNHLAKELRPEQVAHLPLSRSGESI